MTDEKKTEIANKIKNNPTLRKIIENALDKDTIEKIEKKFERLLKAENLKKLSVTVHDDDDYLPT